MFSGKKAKKIGDTACIFVHAGAGFHSHANEIVHLTACNDAAKVAMTVLNTGGSALDAVELAIKCLEDREITNAGYGSNLAIDGVVECDALIVDHNGRSGAAGAVAQIKNPISLARILLDRSATQLSLRRVPPNMLVGQGATDFAFEHGMPVGRHDTLISPSAQERWRRWSQDLLEAERKEREADAARYGLSPTPSEADFDPLHLSAKQERRRKQHTAGMAEALRNDAQPVSPPASDDRGSFPNSASPSRASSAVSIPQAYSVHTNAPEIGVDYTDPYGPPGLPGNQFTGSSSSVMVNATESIRSYGTRDGGYSVPSGDELEVRNDDSMSGGVMLGRESTLSSPRAWEGSTGSDSAAKTPQLATSLDSTPRFDSFPAQHTSPPSEKDDDAPTPSNGFTMHPSAFTQPPAQKTSPAHEKDDDMPTPLADSPKTTTFADEASSYPPLQAEDHITDTVGAIAIDIYGNIACAASSGGIGMKHRGRVGPAALVGVGANVIPVDPDDPDRTTVATVTSGTGEHMGTTFAAQVCSQRIFHSERRTPGNGTEKVSEDEAIRGFIERDFMNHPSVRNSQSTGAIGMLSVKRTSDGAWLYFAHNTDSFAIASMSQDDPKPSCCMSRSKGHGTIAQGGRGVRFRRKK